jgi:hypothetical protein
MTFSYEKQRSGMDMQYRVNVTISTVSGNSRFGYPIYMDLTMDGVTMGSATVKSATPYQWYSAITYTSPWYTVSGKINGTTSLVIKMYSGLGSSRTGTYAYTMEVEPAGATIEVVNGTLGTPLTFEVTRPNSSHTYSILYICGTKSGMVCSDSTASTMTWDTTNGNTVELATENTVGTSVSVLLRITTYNGSWPIFMRDYTISMVIPSSVKPSVALTVEDAAGHLATFGAFVQGWSKLKITATPTLAYGSPIKAYAITADGKTYDSTPVTTGAIQGKGTLTLTANVTDSRERPSDVVSENITVLEYYKPSVTAIAYRCNSSGVADPEGAYMRVGFTATLANLNNKNSASYEITYSGGTLTGTGTSFTSNPIACDVSRVWSIEVKVTDKFDSTTASAVVPIAFTLMDFYNTGKGVALGKVATRDGFDCAMDAYFTGNVRFDKGFVDGSDTGWVDLSNVVKYRYKNGYVTLVGGSYGDVSLKPGEYTVVGTLPEAYCPTYQVAIVYHTTGGTPLPQSGFVFTDGTVKLYVDQVTTNYWAFAVTYPL